MTTIGKNTVAGEELQGFIDRVENINSQIAGLNDDKAAVMSEAKARGFSKKRIGEVIKIRKQKPQDRQEAEAELDMYLHAIGMASEPPLLRYIAHAGVDTAVREQVIEVMKDFVPPHGLGDITVNMGGRPFRLYRNRQNEVEIAEVLDKPLPGLKTPRQAKPKADVPSCTDDQAEEMGRQFARDNRPIIDNPFPYGDSRRPRFDKGWRRESGNDGMGPAEDDED